MKHQCRKSTLLLFLTISGCHFSFAEVYSTIIRTSKLDGYEDCFKIEYALHDTNGTLNNVLDDILLGTFSVVVGSDCVTGGGGNFISDDEGHGSSTPTAVKNYKFESYPNPASNELKINYSHEGKSLLSWTWHLISDMNGVVKSGNVVLSDVSELSIDTSLLRPGQYTLFFLSEENDMSVIKVLIVN